ncbi:MAG: DbpA RNA binding domain-containing protein [Treponema sp.]|jgi:hypothetical protein|nr:DbpA RNA binding domain-containing protein [Treponema sp.]
MKTPSIFDKEKAKKNLEVIMEKLHNDTNLVMFSEYRKLYKKEISLFRRMDAAAWLFMYYDQKEIPSMRSVVTPKTQKNKTPPAEEKSFADIMLPEDVSKKLFISIGKNRRLYPREIITLIMSKTKVPREDIGMIRILDNYSFVQVRDTKADEIIEALNGVKFRGRNLTVNFAKSKTGEE